jgi:hypothetical protein
MSDEQDSWFQSAFGLDIGGVANKIRSEAEQAAGKVQGVVQGVKTAVEGVVDDVVGKVTDVAKKVAGAAGVGGGGAGGGGAGGGSPKTAGPAGGGTGSFPLSGSVGRGGRNAPGDVKAVQQALGIGVDGGCGSKTIGAIEAFQRSIGQANPDGRVDAGGTTERALAGGGKSRTAAVPASTSHIVASDPEGLFDRVTKGAQALGGMLDDVNAAATNQVQSAQNAVFDALGVSDETRAGIQAMQQAIADFDKGREKGHADATLGFVNILPPVQAVKAAVRIAGADDKQAEAEQILQEKSESAAVIGQFMEDPFGSAAKMGASVGTRFAKDTLKAQEEGRLAEHAGELAGHAQFAGELAGITVGVGSLAGGGAVAAGEGGTIAAEGGSIAAEGGTVVAEEGAAIAAEEGAALATEEGVGLAAEEGAELAVEEGAGSGLKTPVPKTPPPGPPLPLRPTEIPKGPEFAPTRQPPGPAPDFGPNTPNPFEDPFNPRFPKPPRVPPDIEPLQPPDTIPEGEPVFEPDIEPLAPDTIPDVEPVFEPDFELPPDTIPDGEPVFDRIPDSTP